MSFSQRFADLLESKGITPYRMSKDTGIPEATIGRWKNGKVVPSGERLTVAVKYLNTSADYLLENEQKNKPATERDELKESILELFNHLSPDGKKELIEYAQYKVEHQAKK